MIPGVHYAAAAAMFAALAFFCFGFYRRAMAKGHPRAKVRAAIYALCGAIMFLSVVALAANAISHERLALEYSRLVYLGEAGGLVSFGISWLTASRTLPILTTREERFSPLRASNPP